MTKLMLCGLDLEKLPSLKRRLGWFSLLALAAAAVSAGSVQESPSPQQEQQKQTSEDTAESPYDKWLNEDVTYIINEDERFTFQTLNSDDERKRFIEQFWRRRDKSPDTPDNKVKEEHYRRIAYSNEHFRSGTPGGRAGWKTDRGRVYIVYGPPDEIESHPKGAGDEKPFPNEVWKYRHVVGVGDNLTVTFVDPTRKGDYRLAPGNGK